MKFWIRLLISNFYYNFNHSHPLTKHEIFFFHKYHLKKIILICDMFLSKKQPYYSILMHKVKNSDSKAFRELYDALWQPLYVRVYTILRDKQQSEDIVQEVWIDLWQRKDQIANENIEAFLFRAVRFKAYNQYRNSSKRREILQNIFASTTIARVNDVEESIFLQETTEAILKSVDALPPKCKKVFELSRFEGLKNKEISQKLGISQRTVENHISNALKKLRTEIATLGILFFFLLILS